MDTQFALAKVNGSREELARLLGVAPLTTYHWKQVLPPKHERYLRLLRPDWFIEWESSRKKK